MNDLTLAPWNQITPPFLYGNNYPRNPRDYAKCLDQFDVDTNPRYATSTYLGKRSTFCNIYVSDVTMACGCPILHCVPGRERTANDMVAWLLSSGDVHGWVMCNAQEAVLQANQGNIVVAGFQNIGAIGHIAMVRPESTPQQILVAQAGVTNAKSLPIQSAFGKYLQSVTYFFHN